LTEPEVPKRPSIESILQDIKKWEEIINKINNLKSIKIINEQENKEEESIAKNEH